MDDPANHPVLVHCFAGVHRTGAHIAIYRMVHDRWPNAKALGFMPKDEPVQSELRIHLIFRIGADRQGLNKVPHSEFARQIA
jgi:protein tyrosine/serine phosphatase